MTETRRASTSAALAEVERQLTAIWVEVLQLPEIRRDDDFFAISGDSMMALELTARAREVFAIDIAVRTVFDHPTVAEMAIVVHQEVNGRDAGDDR